MPSNTTQKSRRKKHQVTYKIYYGRILKRNRRLAGITMNKSSVDIMDSMMNDMFEKIVVQAVQMMRYNNRKVLTDRDIKFAVRLIVPGDLGACGVRYADKSMAFYKKGGAKISQQNSL
jgi:histone H2B